jgi:hypothetical protein
VERSATPQLPLARELVGELLHFGHGAGVTGASTPAVREQEHELHRAS